MRKEQVDRRRQTTTFSNYLKAFAEVFGEVAPTVTDQHLEQLLRDTSLNITAKQRRKLLNGRQTVLSVVGQSSSLGLKTTRDVAAMVSCIVGAGRRS